MSRQTADSNDAAEFLRPPCDAWRLDVYHLRSAILKALTAHLPQFSGTVLDVGCGLKPYRPILLAAPSRATVYLGLDLAEPRYGGDPDLTWDGRTIPLPNAAVDSALSTEVLEHCPDPAGILSEVNRVLKPGGFFLLTVPFLWPLHDAPYDEFRFTPFSLRRLLGQAGFEHIEVRALGGWDAALAQMVGLWVRRRPMRETVRRVLQKLVLPVYRRLLAGDRPPAAFDMNVMVTGFCVTARASGQAGSPELAPEEAPR